MPGRTRLAAALAGAVLLAGCSGNRGETSGTSLPELVITTTSVAIRQSDGMLSIGMLLPSTGSGAALGANMREAVRNTITEINAAGGVLGRDVQLHELDEAAEGGIAELVERGVDAIVGPASSLVALNQLGAAVEAGVVVCSPTASALALDSYPDQSYFFRTIPSDSLQMAALAQIAGFTGQSSIAVAYLDDPYGRGLAGAFTDSVGGTGAANTGLALVDEVPFASTDEDLTAAATELLAGDPDLVAVLADGDDGGRFLAALDEVAGDDPPEVLVNDAMRTARQAIAGLSDRLRSRITAIAPQAVVDGVDGFFAANAVDCVNLIALAAVSAETDLPRDFRNNIGTVSYGGRACRGFARCAELLQADTRIDYDGLSGPTDVRGLTGDLIRARFDVFGFDESGAETEPTSRTLPN